MIDSYVLLTPILLLGVMAVAGFVGCSFTIAASTAATPTNLHAVPGDAEVDLKWDDYPDATEFHVFRGLSSGTLPEDYPPPKTITPDDVPAADDLSRKTYTDLEVSNGTKYFYRISAIVPDLSESSLSNEDSATPAAPMSPPLVSFVLPMGVTLGLPRTDFTGSAGMKIQVGSTPLIVKTLGRIVDSAHTGLHVVSIVDPATSQSRSVTVDTATAEIGKFAYAPLAVDVTLTSGATYYVVSEETNGVEFYNVLGTTVDTNTVASVLCGVYSDANTPFTVASTPGHTYGPVDFQYLAF